jgi:hypothetical protein
MFCQKVSQALIFLFQFATLLAQCFERALTEVVASH